MGAGDGEAGTARGPAQPAPRRAAAGGRPRHGAAEAAHSRRRAADERPRHDLGLADGALARVVRAEIEAADTDRDGGISAAELLAAGLARSRREARRRIREADADGDGQINYAELLAKFSAT